MKEKAIETKEKATSLVNEFKDFITVGNVMDMTVGVIVGGAFGKIVTSLVNDILMPLIGILIGGLDFSKLNVEVAGASVNYGNFILNVVDFLIIAACIFFFVKAFQHLKHKVTPDDEGKDSGEKSDELVVLEEIRDLLKEKN